ncbi:MAG: hypothetical protein KGN84_14645 [Acidobacteriota bacterium]|nr:hypothetical protein [Acidobacteriota bacterium]
MNIEKLPANPPANRNAVKEGLYTRHAYIRPGEEAAFQQIIGEIYTDLQPEGALEELFAHEIAAATWRLRRCGLVEGNLAEQTLIDPMEDEAFEKKQRSIDRARAHAHNVIRRSLAELRRLQTERATRRELEITHEESVLVDTQKVSRSIEAKAARDEIMHNRVRKAEEEYGDALIAAPIVPQPAVPLPDAA